MSGKDIHLPPEFCLLDGVSNEVRKSKEMRDAMQAIRVLPHQKIAKIQELRQNLSSQRAISDWGIEIQSTPIELTTNVLNAPMIIKNNQLILCDEKEMRKQAIKVPKDLLENQWIMCYQHSENGSQYDSAQKVFEDLQECSKKIGVRVEEPFWIELQDEGNVGELEK